MNQRHNQDAHGSSAFPIKTWPPVKVRPQGPDLPPIKTMAFKTLEMGKQAEKENKADGQIETKCQDSGWTETQLHETTVTRGGEEGGVCRHSFYLEDKK